MIKNKDFKATNDDILKIYNCNNSRELLLKNYSRLKLNKYVTSLFNKGVSLVNFPNVSFECFNVTKGVYIPVGIYIISNSLAYVILDNGFDIAKYIKDAEEL